MSFSCGAKRRLIVIVAPSLFVAFASLAAQDQGSAELAEQAVEAISKDQWQAGRQLLLKAIDLNPNDFGQAFVIEAQKQLTRRELEFGRQQVSQMLEDRAAMRDCLKDGDPLLEWAANQFAGVRTGQPMEWCKDEPTAFLALHHVPTERTRGKSAHRF